MRHTIKGNTIMRSSSVKPDFSTFSPTLHERNNVFIFRELIAVGSEGQMFEDREALLAFLKKDPVSAVLVKLRLYSAWLRFEVFLLNVKHKDSGTNEILVFSGSSLQHKHV